MILSKPQTIILPTQGDCNTCVTLMCDSGDKSGKVSLAEDLANRALYVIRGPPYVHHASVFLNTTVTGTHTLAMPAYVPWPR